MSKIKAGTTTTTAYQVEADTTGTLVLQTGSTPTTALTIGADQTVTTAGTINGLTVGKGAGAVSTNTAVGASALAANTTGSDTTAFGYQSGYSQTTGTQNTYFGEASGYLITTGNYNVAGGFGALASGGGSGGAASYNVALGVSALKYNTASYNTALGWGAAYTNTTGSGLTVVGQSALYSNTTGSYNVAFGNSALLNNTTASSNTAVGYQAGYASTVGGYSTFVGYQAGLASAWTSDAFANNTFVGALSGSAITTGRKNTIVGLYNGNQGGLNITTANNYIVLSDGDGNPRGIFDNNGDFLVGKVTASDTGNSGLQARQTGYVTATRSQSTNSDSTFHVYSTGVSAYRFYVGMGGTVYATSTSISAISDIRFKENVRDLDAGLTEVMALKPRLYDWKEGKGANIKNARGFIAQEFEQVFPDLIDEWKDEAPEGEEPYKSVRQDLIPVLVKAIQELNAKLEAQAAEIAALKGQA